MARGAAVRRLAARVRVKLLVELKMLLQRLGVPRRADVFFACAWDWRYPPYLYRSLRPAQVVELPRADLPFALAYGSLREFFLRTRGVRPGERPTAHTVVGAPPVERHGEFRRRLRISYDYFEPHEAADAVTMPYFGHPDYYRLRLHEAAPGLRDARRTVRVFFAGTADEEKYQGRFAFPIATRTEILRAVTEGLGDELAVVRTRAELARVRAGEARRILFALSARTDDTTERHLMTPAEYLALLARSDFFLAPPGWVMPHCHNIVEAMSVGTIPVTNYGAYLTPPLTPDVDCVAFDTPAELVAQLRRVLALPPEEVATLRANVVRYYEAHLSPAAFRRRLDARGNEDLTLRVNVEPGR